MKPQTWRSLVVILVLTLTFIFPKASIVRGQAPGPSDPPPATAASEEQPLPPNVPQASSPADQEPQPLVNPLGAPIDVPEAAPADLPPATASEEQPLRPDAAPGAAPDEQESKPLLDPSGAAPGSAAVVGQQDFANLLGSLPGVQFVHTATTANISSASTEIDHPLLNNHPNANLFVTQNWNPGGKGSSYNGHKIGVWYNTTSHKWGIFNEDNAAMPANVDFNVFVPSAALTSFAHTAAVGNITSSWTRIDHPLTNNNPNAMVIVTQNWNANGSGGQYNNHAIGVWYDGSKWAVFNQDSAAMIAGVDFNILIPTVDSSIFVHTATVANTSFASTDINHPLTNNNPNAIVYVTQNWNPGGSAGQSNNHPIGAWYNSTEGKWAIFNEDLGTLSPGLDFNVYVPNSTSSAFVHTTTAANTSFASSEFDHPLSNNNPNALVFTTQNWNPGGSGGTYNNHETGVWYTGFNKWAVFNEDLINLPLGADFNILIPKVDTAVFQHTTTAATITGSSSAFEHPLTTGDPNAIVFATQNLNPNGTGIQYNNHPIAVWYNGTKWAVFNEDLAAMPVGVDFNLFAPPHGATVFVHRATAGNTFFNYTQIDNPLSNNNPQAIVIVTQNWNPGGVGGQYNNHKIGVWYNGGTKRWAIFNQDLVNMPVGAAFNVSIYGTRMLLPLVIR